MMKRKQVNRVWCSLIIMSVLTICLLHAIRQLIAPTEREIMMMKANNESRHVLNLFHLVKNQNLNIVTAYYRTQKLQVGEKNYHTWMNAFAVLHNTVTLYTDDAEIGKYFTKLRQHLSFATVIVELPESNWSNHSLANIRKLSLCSNDTSFPFNTEEGDVCTILSKILVIEHAIHKNYFAKDYNCWMNLNILHRVVSSKQYFRLDIPFDLSENSVGVSKPIVARQNTDLDILTGGVYVGHVRSLSAFCKHFKQEALKLYAQNVNVKDSDNEYRRSVLDTEQHQSPLSFDVRFYGQSISGGKEGYDLLKLMYQEVYG